MELKQAEQIARRYLEQLRPYCLRIEIAGSIRRRRPEVKDIEIVCVPRRVPIITQDLFGNDDPVLTPCTEFIDIVGALEKVRGDPGGRYTQRKLPEGINLDLFICFENNWGNIFAIRTGSAEYSHVVLAGAWVRAGYKSVEGYLYKNGQRAELFEEVDLYKLLAIDWLPPEKREL